MTLQKLTKNFYYTKEILTKKVLLNCFKSTFKSIFFNKILNSSNTQNMRKVFGLLNKNFKKVLKAGFTKFQINANCRKAISKDQSFMTGTEILNKLVQMIILKPIKDRILNEQKLLNSLKIMKTRVLLLQKRSIHRYKIQSFAISASSYIKSKNTDMRLLVISKGFKQRFKDILIR